MTALVIVLCIAFGEAILMWRVEPFYFRSGLTVFRRTIACDCQGAAPPSVEQIEYSIPGSIWPDFLLREISPQHIAFRERFFKGLMAYTPIMRGMLELDLRSGVVTVSGRVNWYPLAFLIFVFLTVAENNELVFGVAMVVIFCVIYLIQAIRFSLVARAAADLWSPSFATDKQPASHQDVFRQSKSHSFSAWQFEKIPMGLVVIAGVVLFVAVLHFYSAQQDPYRDLASAYQTTHDLQAKSISPETVGFTSANRKSSMYRRTMKIRLSTDALELEPTFPDNVGKRNVVVPIAEVSGCSETCSGSGEWDADILIGRTKTEIRVSRSREVIDWCWSNHIPMVSGKDRRALVYAGAPLPARSAYTEQFASREQYEKQAEQSCLGY